MKRFNFGSNWRAFSLKQLDAQRLSVAESSLSALLQRERLNGARVLDVGCGSGLFSIAAQHLGAGAVTGTDINPDCISVSNSNRERFAPGAPITFMQMSVLCAPQMDALGAFDLVYAWGSLHHTGALWNAVRNVARCVTPGGILVLAIYNEHITSPLWKRIKWLYNQLPAPAQNVMVLYFAGIIWLAKLLVTGRNPAEKERGMDFWYDVIDWVGGYPYEYAKPAAVTQFLSGLGFTQQRMVPASVPTGCNEFVFVRLPDPSQG